MNICGLQKSSAANIFALILHSDCTSSFGLGVKIGDETVPCDLYTQSPMGFDLFIHLKLMMCPETGKPFYFGDTFQKIYTIPEFTVPENLREYLQGRGHQFHAYITEFPRDVTEIDLELFLEEFPSWEAVLNDPSYDKYYWTHKDHMKFEELLKYLATLGYPFSVSWSY